MPTSTPAAPPPPAGASAFRLDELDQRILEMLRVNARLPVVKMAHALGVTRATVQARMAALEGAGVITGYTVGVSHPRQGPRIRAMIMLSVASRAEPEVVQALSRRYEIVKLWATSGRYDLCALAVTDHTEELDALIERIRGVQGVQDTFSTILLSTKLDRPDWV